LPQVVVIFTKLTAQTACLHAHDRVDHRVEGIRSIENLNSDNALLKSVRATRKGRLHDVTEKATLPVRVGEDRACENTGKLPLDLLDFSRCPAGSESRHFPPSVCCPRIRCPGGRSWCLPRVSSKSGRGSGSSSLAIAIVWNRSFEPARSTRVLFLSERFCS